MDRTLHVLLVTSDPSLQPELEDALEGLRSVRAVVHAVRRPRDGIEACRSRPPDLVVVELGDPRALRTFTEEVQDAAPDAVVAAVFRPDALGEDAADGRIFVEALRANVKDFLRRPLSSGELGQLVERLTRDPRQAGAGGAVVSFVSNKGGVGKSTLSVNAACGLAGKHPDRVLLIDSSLQLGTCASMLDLEPRTTIADAVREYDRLDETLLRQISLPHDSGLRLLAAPNDPAEAYEIEAEAIGRIISLARRTFDHVVVDTFPLLDDVVMTVLDLSDRTYVVTNATVPTVLGTSRLLGTLERLGVPASGLRVVLNLSHADFPGGLAPSDVAQRLQRDIDHLVPYQKQLLTAVNTGRPYVLDASRLFAFGRAMARLVSDLEGVTATGRTRGVEPAALRGSPPGKKPIDPPPGRESAQGTVDLSDGDVVIPDGGRLPSSSGRLFPELVEARETPAPRVPAEGEVGDALDELEGEAEVEETPPHQPGRR